MLLTKTNFLNYLRHPAWMWLAVHDKKRLPPVDAATQRMFDEGHAFEAYAEALYPGGFRLGFHNYQEYLSLPARTADALASGHPALFQARFETKELTCIVDVLRRSNDRYDLIEIKSSTSVKPEHLVDLAFQTIILEDCGLPVGRILVNFVNTAYTRQGAIDVAGLVSCQDVTAAVRELLQTVRLQIKNALATLSSPTLPDPSPRFCNTGYAKLDDWLTVYRGLHPDLPETSIYRLARLTPALCGQLEDLNIATIDAIPADIALPEAAARQREAVLSGRPQIDIQKIKTWLGSLTYPLYFLDYETSMSVVPPFDGLHPYQQVPFQYSLHVIDQPGATPRHLEFLHLTRSNPMPDLLRRLRQDIGPTGSVLAWYRSFEMARHTEMAAAFPEHRDWLEQLNSRVVDLMDPFFCGWYSDARFGGSASIKKVLPVLVPELSYDNLAIHEGGTAQAVWMNLILAGSPSGESPTPDATPIPDAARVEAVARDLLAYCELDTLAMVEIFNFLTRL